MSATENSEFAVPEVIADDKEASKEIKAAKRPAEVSVYPILNGNNFFHIFSHDQAFFILTI